MSSPSSSIAITKQPSIYITGDAVTSSTSSLTCLPIENNAKHFQTAMIWAYHAPSTADSAYMPISMLRSSLTALINVLPVIAGEIADAEGIKGNARLTLSNKGVRWTEASADCTLDSIIPCKERRYAKPKYAGQDDREVLLEEEITVDYENLNPLSLQEPVSYSPGQPIVSFQLTRFSCHSLLIAVSAQHVLFDASCIGQLMVYWGEIAREGKLKEKVNWSDRRFLEEKEEAGGGNAKEREQKEVEKPQYINYKKVKSAEEGIPTWTYPDSKGQKLISRVIPLSAQEVSAIKQAAMQALPSSTSYISSYDAIYAHFIQCIYAAQKAAGCVDDKDQDPLLLCQSLNGRKHFGFTPDNNFFGQFAFWLCGPLEKEHLSSLSAVANTIHHMHSCQSRSSLTLFNRWLIPLSPTLSYGENALVADICGRDFYMSSWAKADYYEAEFGYGRPDYCGPTQHSIVKVLVLMDSAETADKKKEGDDKGYDVMLALFESEWKELMRIIHAYRK